MIMIGWKIKEMRKRMKLSQKALALKLGIDNSHLSKIESGKNMPTIPQIIELSTILNVSTDWLFDLKKDIHSLNREFDGTLEEFIKLSKKKSDLLQKTLDKSERINDLLEDKIKSLEDELSELKKELQSKDPAHPTSKRATER